jgi:hypothetical protein
LTGRLAADIRPVHRHAVVTGCGYTYPGRTYRRSSHDRSTSRSARNTGHAHRRSGPGRTAISIYANARPHDENGVTAHR